MIQIKEHAEGCVIPVRAQTCARNDAIIGEQAGALKISVKAPPDQGRANKAILRVLCDRFDLKQSQVDLLSGHTSRAKKILVRGVAAADLTLSLQEVLASVTRPGE